MLRRDSVASENFLLNLVNRSVREPALRQSLHRDISDFMSVRSQRAIAKRSGDIAAEDAEAAFEEVQRKNVAHLRHILKIYGWPTRAMVGLDGVFAAYYLAVFSDKDLPLQKQCLELMIEVEPEEVPLNAVARLTDLILLAEGKPQRYGTQSCTDTDGVYRPSPIEDEANVDARRATMGLNTLSQQRAERERWYTDESVSSTE